MARVTVEDCIDKVENRFELVLLGCASRSYDLERFAADQSTGTMTRTRLLHCGKLPSRPSARKT